MADTNLGAESARANHIEKHADAIMRAAGSKLSYYETRSRAQIINAVQEACGHFDRIRSWASDRNLIEGSNPRAQLVKLREEVGELSDAIADLNKAEFADAIGDCIVVLAIMAAQWGLRVEDCIAGAYEEIRHRKGRLKNGVFVKETSA